MPDNDLSPETLVARLHAEASRLVVSIASPASDERMGTLLDELFVVITRLAQAPARDAKDLSMKLDVLCRRLREDVDPENRGDVLTYLLTEAIRGDHTVLQERDPCHCPSQR
jgi:hypothetical protein